MATTISSCRTWRRTTIGAGDQIHIRAAIRQRVWQKSLTNFEKRVAGVDLASDATPQATMMRWARKFSILSIPS